MQAEYNEELLTLYSIATLKAWDKFKETGKRLESFSQVFQGPKETFTDFMQRLTSVIGRNISDSLCRKALIETLALENANAECNEVITPLKIQSAPMLCHLEHQLY